MSSPPFRRAKLVPFDAGGQNPQEGQAIALDFNPETLTLKVSAGQQRDRGRRGRQEVQNVGASKATLTFECVFDSTRPRDDPSGEAAGGEEQLDVRRRSKPIADLLQVFGSGREQAPRRVQFRWGTLIFNGVISSHQEVFDYFSPSGVPLRSKVQLTLTEQEFRYQVSADEAAQRRQAISQAAAGAREQAAAAGAAGLLAAAGGAPADLRNAFQLDALGDALASAGLSAELGLSASFGLAADLGAALGAGVPLDAAAALDLFGAGAVLGGADLARSGTALPPTSPGLSASGALPQPWAPDGPAPGSAAAGLAAVVTGQRAGGAVSPPVAAGLAGSAAAGSTSAGASAGSSPGAARPGGRASAMPALRGSPPQSPRWTIDGGRALFTTRPPLSTQTGERRPRWEFLPPASESEIVRPTRAAGGGCASCGAGCGCQRCRGALR